MNFRLVNLCACIQDRCSDRGQLKLSLVTGSTQEGDAWNFCCNIVSHYLQTQCETAQKQALLREYCQVQECSWLLHMQSNSVPGMQTLHTGSAYQRAFPASCPCHGAAAQLPAPPGSLHGRRSPPPHHSPQWSLQRWAGACLSRHRQATGAAMQ